LHLLRGAVRDIAVECERLVETDGVRVAPRRKLCALDLIEAIISKEHRRPLVRLSGRADAELPTINTVNAVGEVDLDLATLSHSFESLIDDGGLLKTGITSPSTIVTLNRLLS
jgi:hypothetical protein